MGFGTVYVFNIYSSAIEALHLNQMGSAGRILPPTKGSDPPWTPCSLAVGRSNLRVSQLAGPQFVNGINTLAVHYLGMNKRLEIDIPGPPGLPLEQDLWLYIAFEHANLYEVTGNHLPNPQAAARHLGAYPMRHDPLP